jgi:hypothetical protein
MPLCPGAGRGAGHDDLRRGLKAYAFKTPARRLRRWPRPVFAAAARRAPVSSGRDEAVSEHKPFARPLCLVDVSRTTAGCRRNHDQLWWRHESGRAIRPQRARFRAEGPFRRSREARLASARTGDGVRRRDDAALVAPPHSAVSGGSSNSARQTPRAGKCSDETAAPHGR